MVLLMLFLSHASAVSPQGSRSLDASGLEGVPSAPRDPALAASDSALNLTWSPPENDNGSAVTNYLVYMGTDPQFLFLSGNTSNAWHNVSGLQNGRRHYFAVTAVNADGEGPRSAQVSGIPRPPGLALGRVEIAPRLSTVQVGLKQRMIASVFDSRGWDVDDATVAWSVGGSIGTMDAGGNFTATSVGVGEIRVSATRSASAVNNSSAVTVTAKLYSIDGQVVDFYDQGVDNASVFLFDETTGKELEMVITLDNGSFVFRVPNGQYYVQASAKGYTPAFRRGIEIRDAPATGIVVKISRPGEEAPPWALFAFFGIVALIIGLVLYMIVVRAARGRARREGERAGDESQEEERDESKPVSSSLVVEKSPPPRGRAGP